MAALQKLGIRGIRSFNPRTEEAIEFYSPLTMIVGANGCGKTTIIECLKMACTGSLPPSSRNGQTFIHDPKIEEEHDVKALIRLRFTRETGKSMVVVRGFQLSNKNNKLSFKALDGVIRSQDGDKKSSISAKCSELDKTVPQCLGVSAAILENVIFCHQEESSWPLQEGKVVKQKFDDIFESTRYTKALDQIRKTKLEYASKVKDIKAELAALYAHKAAAIRLEETLQETDDKLTKVKEEIESINANIAKDTEALTKLQAVSRECTALRQEKQDKEMRLSERVVLVEEKKERMGANQESATWLQRSEEEVTKAMEEQQQRLKESEAEREQLSQNVHKTQKKLRKLKGVEQDLTLKQGTLKQMYKDQTALVADRDNQLQLLSDRFGIFVPTDRQSQQPTGPGQSAYSTEVVTDFERDLAKHVTEKESALVALRQQHRQKGDERQAAIAKLQTQMETSDVMMRSKKGEADKLDKEAEKLGIETRNSSVTKSQVDEAARQQAKADAALEAHTTAHNVEQLENDRRKLDKAISEADHDIENEKVLLVKLEADEEDNKAVLQRQDRLKERRQRLDADCKESGTMGGLLTEEERLTDGSVDALKDTLAVLAAKLEDGGRDVEERSKAVTDLIRAQTEKDTVCKQAKRERAHKKQEQDALTGSIEALQVTAREMKKQIREGASSGKKKGKAIQEAVDNAPTEVEHSDYMSSLLALAKDRTERCMQAWQKGKSIKTMISHFKAEVKDDGCCPACKRGLEKGTDDMKAFDQTMQTWAQQAEMAGTDERLYNEAKEDVEALEGRAEEWNKWMSIGSRLTELDREIAGLEAEVSEKAESTAFEETALKRGTDTLEQVKLRHGDVERWLKDANSMAIESKEAQATLDRLTAFSAGAESNRDIGDVRKALDELLTKKDRLQTELRRKSTAIDTARQESYRLGHRKRNAEDMHKELAANLERQETMKKRLAEVRMQRQELSEDIRKQEEGELPLKQELGRKSKEHEQFRRYARTAEDEAQDLLSDTTAGANAFRSLQERLNKSMESDLMGQMKENEANIARNKEGYKVANEQWLEAQARLDEAEADGSEQEKFASDAREALTIIAMEKEREAMQREILALEEKIREKKGEHLRAGGRSLHDQISTLDAGLRTLESDKAEQRGKYSTLHERHKELKRSLRADDYRDVKAKHCQKQQEFSTTEMAVKDLDKFWLALDKSLLSYHAMKIADINKAVHQLWGETYKGQDIDKIEIVSGEEGGSTKARRSYNYRVAMTKDGTNLDMKGRCSAGQRVLASIVIRLALAETFCLKCSVLALDEPTTNLDQDNKNGLAEALAKIIADRSQKAAKFQLVVITHDEEFVSTMSQKLRTHSKSAPMPEYYWRISREKQEGKFYSKIAKHEWEELNNT